MSLDPVLEAKILRRARRALDALDSGAPAHVARVSSVTPGGCAYRLVRRPGAAKEREIVRVVRSPASPGGEVRVQAALDLRAAADLLLLRGHVGTVRAYKATNAEGSGPHRPGLRYVVGSEVSVAAPDSDENRDCGAGVNLGTLEWCLAEARAACDPERRLFAVELDREDVAAIPVVASQVPAGDSQIRWGKFRARRCRVVEEIPRSAW